MDVVGLTLVPICPADSDTDTVIGEAMPPKIIIYKETLEMDDGRWSLDLITMEPMEKVDESQSRM